MQLAAVQPQKIKILLVDDMKTQILFEKSLLGSTRFDYVTASNGREAISIARTESPDIILLDVMMPDMDGIETARRIREDPATSDIPIIMVTTRSEAEKVERAYIAGCTEYLTKPVQKNDLITRICALTGADL